MSNLTMQPSIQTKIYSSIQPEMSLMEVERKKLNKLTVTSGILGFLFILLIPVGINFGPELYQNHKTTTIILAVGISIFLLVTIFLLAKAMLREFKFIKNFKEKIIKKIVNEIYGNFEYIHHKHITKENFNESKIFETASTLTGDDYFKGTYDSVDFEFSEIIYGGSGQSISNFHGLYFIFNFPKNSSSDLRIWPSNRDFGNTSNVILEDDEFNKLFTVVGSDQIKCRHILSLSFMERYIEFYKKTGREVFLSFVDNKMHLAINFNRENFEPKLEQTMANEKSIQEIIHDLLFVQDVVKTLKLDLKIWGD